MRSVGVAPSPSVVGRAQALQQERDTAAEPSAQAEEMAGEISDLKDDCRRAAAAHDEVGGGRGMARC